MTILIHLVFTAFNHAFAFIFSTIRVEKIVSDLMSEDRRFAPFYTLFAEHFHDKFLFVISNKNAFSRQRAHVYYVLGNSHYSKSILLLPFAYWSLLFGDTGEVIRAISFVFSVSTIDNILYLFPCLFVRNSIVVANAAECLSFFSSRDITYALAISSLYHYAVNNKRKAEIIDMHCKKSVLRGFFPQFH